MSDLVKAVILGIVQGLTEFLPVSSTGHLVIFQEVLGVDEDTFGLSFDASIHLGTLAAVLVYFRGSFLDLALAWVRSLAARRWDASPDARLAWLILLGTLPAGIAGFVLQDVVEETFRSPALVGAMLVLFSAVLVLAERLGRNERFMESVRPLDALFIGAAQAVALIPGVSRSGITISAGMLAGLRRPEAAAFAFMLSAPVIAAAGGFGVVEMLRGDTQAQTGDPVALFLIGMTTAGIVGYGAIAFLLRFLRGNPLYIFVAYRVGLGAIVLGLVAAGRL